MGLLKWLKNKNDGKQSDQELVDADFCPNCWGSQAYDGKFIEAVKDQQIDINNHDSTANRAFIQAFVKANLEPIRLKRQDVYAQCPRCKAKYG